MIDKYAYAHNRIRKLARQMRKQSATVSDWAGGVVGDSLAGAFGVPSGVVGDFAGMAMPVPTIQDIKKMDQNAPAAFIPGFGKARLMMRSRAVRNLLKDRADQYTVPWADWFGSSTSLLASGAAGAGIGGLAGGGRGAIVGAGLGLGLGGAATIGSSIAALAKRRRTLEEQAAAENDGSTLARLLIPGVANYNAWKRLGASKHLSEMSEDDINKEVARIKKLRGVK